LLALFQASQIDCACLNHRHLRTYSRSAQFSLLFSNNIARLSPYFAASVFLKDRF
jgi:hypothetical protein